MKTSVALCTYNGEKFLARQLDSILSQTRLPDEIVICDDGSRDGTMEILRCYENRGIPLRICANEENLGFAGNFRKCISLCTGDVIFLCDQDDVWHETKVEQLCAIMEADPQIQSLCTNFTLIDENDGELTQDHRNNCFFNRKKWEYESRQDSLYKISLLSVFCHNIAPGCTQVIRKELVPRFLTSTYQEPHDYKLNRLAAIGDGLYYYDEPLTKYRTHGNQTLGIPYYMHAKNRNDYGAMLESYVNIFREVVYRVFIPGSGKVAELPTFAYGEIIACYDRMEMPPKNKAQYEKWKEMAQNREILYAKGPKRWRHFARQGKYNRYFAYNYAFFEKVLMRTWDFTAFVTIRGK